MNVPPPPGHPNPTILSKFVVGVVALTLTLTCGRVTGMPYVHGSLSAGDGRTPLEAVANDLSSRLVALTDKLQAQGVQVDELVTQIAQVMQSVSFTVTFSGRDIGDLGAQQTLKFDKILFNAGDGYSPQTGAFTAPKDGLYAFYIQISRHPTDPNSCVEADLVHGFRKQIPSAFSQQQEPQSSSASPRSQQQSSALAKSQEQPSSSLLFVQHKVCTVSLCIQGDNSTSSRTVLRLGQGDTVHAQMRSGTMLLGDLFTSMSGIKLPKLSLLFGPLLH